VDAADGPVLIAYDGSPAAREAVEAAARLLASRPALVVTVWEPGLAYLGPAMAPDGLTVTPAVDPQVALEVDRGVHEQAEQVARDGAELARSLGLAAAQPLAVPDGGDIARTLLDLARSHNAAAIVVGSRGLSGLRARLEGSTSKGLLKHATVPVVVVHEPDEGRD
jgi:nucleotide-binding universal stress UspA family protein